MLKFSGYLTAALLASALAMPSNADAAPLTNGRGGVPARAAPAMHAAPHFAPSRSGGGMPHFSGRSVGVPHFTARSGGTRFAPRQFATPHITSHRSVLSHTTRFRGVTSSRIRHATGPVQNLHRGQRTIANPNITSGRRNLVSTPNAHARSLRRNGAAAITAQAARQRRFGSRFAGRTGNRFANVAAHRAWRRGLRAGFVPWYGPVFWPYAYSDIFDYAFWPYGYDDGFWDYAYDDFVDGLFWGQYGPPADYAYAPPASPRVSYAGVQELCKQPGTGITAWPFAEIQRKVGLNDEQKQLLGDVRKAAADAAATFKASCPAENTFPLTPPGRLTAMTGRLQATLDAVKVVQPALDKFYNSLSDEQKERFNALGPKRVANNAETAAALPQDSKSCSEAKPGLANLPIEKIEDVVKPTGAQQDGLKQLQDATGKAVSLLQAACPEDTPLTPPGRLTAMEKRLQAMIDAANTVRPALDSFYASLSNEQKARFDRISQQVAQTGG
jgi:hypothetical protein